jgi:hypothetical protein
MKLFKEDFHIVIQETEEGRRFIRATASGGFAIATSLIEASKFFDSELAKNLASKDETLYVYNVYEEPVKTDGNMILGKIIMERC